MPPTKPARWAVNTAGVDPEWAWAWESLLLSLMPGGDADEMSYDPVSRLVWTDVGFLTENTITKYGMGWTTPTTALLDAGHIQPEIDNFTLVMVGRFPLSGGFERALLIKRTGGAASRSFYSTITSGNALVVGTDVPSASSASTSLWTAGESIIVVTSSPSGVRFFQDGSLIDTASALSGSSSTAGFVFGQRATDATNDRFDGDIVLCLLLDGALSDSQVAQISADPFGPIRPARLAPHSVSPTSDAFTTKVFVP